MKKVMFLLFLTTGLTFSISGCKSDAKKDNTDQTATPIPAPAPTLEQLTEQAWNEAETSGTKAAIPDLRNGVPEGFKPATPKAGTIELLRETIIGENSYTFNAHFDHEGKVVSYKGNYRTPDDFQKAYYIWKNEDEVQVALEDTIANKKIVIVLFNDNGVTGMRGLQ